MVVNVVVEGTLVALEFVKETVMFVVTIGLVLLVLVDRLVVTVTLETTT